MKGCETNSEIDLGLASPLFCYLSAARATEEQQLRQCSWAGHNARELRRSATLFAGWGRRLVWIYIPWFVCEIV